MKVLHSFGYALTGIAVGLKERNMRIHVLLTGIVFFFGYFFSITKLEWIAIIVCIGFVMACELFNTALEKLGDIVTTINPGAYNPMGDVKNLAAGSVFVSALTSLFVAIIIFLPHFVQVFFTL